MRILLDDKEIDEGIKSPLNYKYRNSVQEWRCYEDVMRATAKKISLKLQSIYNLPDEGMFHKKLGDFIQELLGEVDSDI